MNRVVVVCLSLLLAVAATATPRKVIRHHGAVPNQYIVVLADGTHAEATEGIARSLAATYAIEVEQVWPYSLQGFLANGPEENVAAMAGDPRVKYAEQNVTGFMPANVSATQYAYYDSDISDPNNPMQYLWTLDRLDELSYAERDGKHNMCTEGRSAVAYVIDYGIYKDHEQFENPSRVVRSLDFFGSANGATDNSNGCYGQGQVGFHQTGHGTAVASVLAGTTIGASKVQLVSMRVVACNRQFYTSDYIEALDWIAGPNNTYRGSPGVINHSGFVGVWDSNFQSYGDAVARTVTNTNIPFFTSADNFSTDACRFSPNHRAYTRTNRTGHAFVVGATSTSGTATDNNDYRWQQVRVVNGQTVPAIGADSGSNGGSCVSIYAPGNDSFVATNSYDPAHRYAMSRGTSFSSPLVAAIAARYMVKERARTGVTPGYKQVYDFLLADPQSRTQVLNTTTAPSYVLCVDFRGDTQAVEAGSPCPTDYTGYAMPRATNTSDARMVFWDEGNGYDCPLP